MIWQDSAAVIAATASGVEVTWSLSPIALALAILLLGIYVRAWRQARTHVRPSAWRAVAFGTGIVVLLGSLVSPIARLGEQMFLWHMIQHILLVDVVPIMLIAGCSAALLKPLSVRLQPFAKTLRWLTRPVTAVALYVGTLWMWHAPALYNLALTNAAVHVFQHVSLLAVGLLFWWHVLEPIPSAHSIRGPGVFPFMAVTKFATGVLASLLTFLPERGLVYDYYVDQPRLWNFTAETDQQLGGAIMVTEELVLMVAAFGLMFIRMLSQADRDDEELERRQDSAPRTGDDGGSPRSPLPSNP